MRCKNLIDSMADGLARNEITNGRERFANGRGRARTIRERARRGANGASGRQLLLEVHESATLFTAGDLPFLK